MFKILFALIPLIFLLPFILSCSKQTKHNTVTNFTLNSTEVWGVMSDAGFGNISNYVIRDKNYSLPSENYIKNDFAGAFRSFLFQLDSGGWRAEENDCDDFALGAAFFMNFLHHNTANKVNKTGIAFGEFFYEKDGAGHAINVAIVREDAKIKVIFFEPQTYSIITLTRKETESCVYWRF